MASLEPKLFCGVALLIGEKLLHFARVREGTTDPQVDRDACHLRHNNCQRPVTALAEQRLHTDRTNPDVAFVTSDPRVRNGRLYVWSGFMSSYDVEVGTSLLDVYCEFYRPTAW